MNAAVLSVKLAEPPDTDDTAVADKHATAVAAPDEPADAENEMVGTAAYAEPPSANVTAVIRPEKLVVSMVVVNTAPEAPVSSG